MDIETLRTFITVSKIKNFTQAANKLYVSQSTVTNRIAMLEKELGHRLFDRTNKNVELTVEGRTFLSYAERMIELTDQSLLAMTQNEKYANTLRIGTANSIYDSYLAEPLKSFHMQHPETALRVTIGMSAHLIEQLQDHIYDMVVSYLPLKKSGYECIKYMQEHLCLVTAASSETDSSGISRNMLTSIEFLMCNFALQDIGHSIRDLFPPYYQFSIEIDDCTKIVPYLLDKKNSYCFLPKHFVKPYIKNGLLREVSLIDFDLPMINIYIIGLGSKKQIWNPLWDTLRAGQTD